MKKLLFTLSLSVLLVITNHAQAPAFFNYQAVARNSVGNALVNKTIRLRLTIREGGALGIALYSETRLVTTNAFGLFNVQVGGGGTLSSTGSVAAISWNLGTKWMQVEIDTEGTGILKDVGTTQFTSVPFALFSNQSSDVVLPFIKTQNEENPLFRITNTGNNASSLAFEGSSSSTANNASAIRGILSSVSPGVNSAAVIGQNNGTGNNGIGVMGTQNGSGWGVYGAALSGVGLYGLSTSGSGVFGQSTSGASVYGFQANTGTGNAGRFQNSSATNNATTLLVQTNGPGEGLGVNMTGSGKAGTFIINNASNTNFALDAGSNGTNNVINSITTGTGRAGFFQVNNTASTADALSAVTNGAGASWAIRGTSSGTNGSGLFIQTNTTNTANNLQSNQAGLGRAALFNATNPANTANAFEVNMAGTGFAASFNSTNPTPKALRTNGGVQFTGLGESANKIMATPDGSGNATWQNAASVGIVSGTGTLNFVPKWTPDGTAIGNSQVFDNGASLGIGTVSPLFKLDLRGTFGVTASDAGFVAVIENTNTGNGDGLKIKLGKTHPMWDGNGYLSTTDNVINSFTPQINTVKNWVLNGTPITAGDVINLVTSTGALLLGTLCQLTNFLTDNINTALNLPVQFPGLDFPGLQIVPQICIIDVPVGGDCEVGIGPYGIPPFTIIPPFTLIPAIPQIPCGGLPTIQAPNMSVFNVSNSLTNENNFLVFTDKDDRELGAVRAQSIEEFRNKTLDIAYFFEMVGKFSGVDLSKGLLLGAGEMAKLAFRYNKIGVEYASGHGDYAEWLEREHLMENITAGDIVRVKSGKITRELNGAEQIMVVSHRPIVLGNMPEKDKQPLGNAVAFMGQVPVKVMGPVNGGDYIVAKGDFAGMGVAVNPENMTTEDFRLCVGRSWETNENDGPKMVNTVVGVHNNDFLKIVANLQQKTQTTEQRLKLIEERLNIPANEANGPSKAKKGF